MTTTATAPPETVPAKPKSKLVPLYRLKLERLGSFRSPARIIASPRTAAAVAREAIGELDREYLLALFLDSRSSVVGAEIVSIGTINASLVHPREVFKAAILANAAAIIMAHNHPSGNAEPSQMDFEATQRIKKAGELLGIPLVDHLVIGAGDAYFSFREAGKII